MNTKVLIRLGKRIKILRMSADLTQEELAEKVNVHPTYIGKIEGGKNNPSFMLLYKISKALKVKLNDMMNVD